jgi:GT2 family glycosyltransferase
MISICISTWNRLEYLKKCIYSILEQDIDHNLIELIIVDNYSNDGTQEYLESLMFNFDYRYKIMDSSNYSAMQTLNTAFKMATGDYILVLDDDSYLGSRHDISSMIDIMEGNENVAIVAPNVLDINGNYVMHFKDPSLGIRGLSDLLSRDPFTYVDFSGAVAMFRNDYVRKVGYYSEDLFIYWNEALLALQMIARGYDLIFAPNIMPVHCASMQNRKVNRNHFYYIVNGNKLINQHLSFKERLFLIPFRSIVLSTHYIVAFKPNVKLIFKLIASLIISHFNIFIGHREKYESKITHEWVRSIYVKFFLGNTLGVLRGKW